jgi:hypothetical protein
VHEALICALRRDLPAAFGHWRPLAARAAELPVQHVFMVSEAAVVLHASAGRLEAVATLAAALRRLDAFNEATPAVRRFRTQWFGAIGPDAPEGEGATLPKLRQLLAAAAKLEPQATIS